MLIWSFEFNFITMDIASIVSGLVLEHASLSRRISIMNDRVGTLECLTILQINLKLRIISDKIKSLTEEFTNMQIADKPLMLVNAGDTYQIKLARGDQIITGEYITIDELIKIADPTIASKVLANMSRMEELLVDNSLHLYRELRSGFKNTHYGKQFAGLVKSKKTEYLYFYMPDRKHTLRFIAEKVELK
jgi:hypothetical protein